ncbi:MAG: 50S ribosomal protein L32e [Thermoplasmata archaeon]
MAEKTQRHHEEFMKLRMFKEEYISKLEAIGIGSPEELAEALKDEARVKEIHDHLKGVGPKTIEHWREDLGVAKAAEPKKTAVKTRKVKAAPAKAPEKATEPEEEKEPERKEPEAEKTEAEAEEEKEPEREEEEAVAEKEEEVEIEEEEAGYEVKLKPKLPKETLLALRKRAEVSSRRPAFLRQEWHARKRLQRTKWRKPMGDHSKMRQHYGYRRNVVSIGYGGPREARYLHPSGFREVRVWNVSDLEKINPELEAARIAHQVGMRKRLEIEEKADELGIRILNRSG